VTGFLSFRLLASVAAVALCAAAPVSYGAQTAAPAAEAAPAAAPQRQLGPPPGAGEGLEDGAPPPPAPAQEKPLVPVAPPSARPATQVDTQPTPEEGTRLLLGEIEILDIPLDQIPNYRDSMREIVSDLSIYAHQRDPKFVVTTRGGFDLLAWSRREFDLDEIKRDPLAKVLPDTIFPVGMPIRTYVQQLNGIILNGQYCAPLRVPRDDLAAMQKRGLKILSIDHCKTAQNAATALQAAIKANVVAHTDADATDSFGVVPKSKPSPENPRNVEVLGDARNMLVMLDSAAYPSREEWLAALQKTNYDVLITDAFYKGNQALTKAEVHGLKFKEIGARRLVLARMNIGYAEDERYYWKREWRIGAPSWIQSFGPDGPGQYVVEFWNPAWKAIVGKYFQGIMDLGFDGVVIDGVEAYRRWEFRTPLDPTSATAAKRATPTTAAAAPPP
jgi:cysteinyl-tRNA synthetase